MVAVMARTTPPADAWPGDWTAPDPADVTPADDALTAVEIAAMDADADLQPYRDYFDELLTEPRMEQWVDKSAWWRRVTGQTPVTTTRARQKGRRR